MIFENLNEDLAAWSAELLDVGYLLRRSRPSYLHAHDAIPFPVSIFVKARPWLAIDEMQITEVNA